ncbi:MAG: ATP synthase F1 subunit epsilon [Clostridiales Family XIII bacterium]|jgi:F-type H+-transporting ATPase subunit epsilon|nr:ATP synthase F1 subunit epsilon [Clostridiales Family XIII bacterium]
MAKSVKLEIVTPERLFYKGDVELVIVRTLLGDEGFMAGHSWACKLLDVGEIWIREAGQKDYRIMAGAQGFIDVRDSIIIFLDKAEWAGDIDIARAMSEKERAEHWLAQHDDSVEDEELVMRAKISIQKATTRMKVAQGQGRGSR